MSGYEYALIVSNDTYHIPIQLVEYEMQLFDAIESSRLKLINDICIDELSPNQQSELLMVKHGVGILEEESIVTVGFIGYLTGRPIVSCRGAYTTLGFGAPAGIRGTIKRVTKQVAETFPK